MAMIDREKLWKYVDGTCSAEEKARLDALLAADAGLREDLEQVEAIHKALQAMQPEQPSLRFSKNVMEAIPKFYPAARAEPLVPANWKKIFWGVVAATSSLAMAVACLPAGQQTSSAEASSIDVLLSKTLDTLASLTQQSLATWAVLVFFSAIILLYLDDKLAARRLFSKKI